MEIKSAPKFHVAARCELIKENLSWFLERRDPMYNNSVLPLKRRDPMGKTVAARV
jgi:hypothetical protein